MQNNECKDFINTYNSELANLTDSITISDDCDEIKFGKFYDTTNQDEHFDILCDIVERFNELNSFNDTTAEADIGDKYNYVYMIGQDDS